MRDWRFQQLVSEPGPAQGAPAMSIVPYGGGVSPARGRHRGCRAALSRGLGRECWPNKPGRCIGHDQRVYGRGLAGSGASGPRRVVCACVRVVHGVAVRVYTVDVRVCVWVCWRAMRADGARSSEAHREKRGFGRGACAVRARRARARSGASGGVGACPVRWLGV